MQLTKLSNKSLNQIFSIERKKKKFNLNNIKKFLKKLNNPEKQLKIIHVAGTNGKGSVCAMIDAILTQSGYRVGMFTSPHLIKINERIRINNKLIETKDLERLNKKVLNLEKKHKINLTFFETLTVIAYLYFKEKNTDYVILETGMGGRLDATNTSTPILSIITNIGLEHTDVLGNTLKDIAKEKAGIIKPNTTIITNAKALPLKIIKNTAKKHNSKLIRAKNNIKTNLKGIFQLENAATASTALKQLNIKQNIINKGLKKVIWPGRFEFKSGILLDCAHNPDGIKALMNSVKQLKYKNLIIIFGTMKDKNIFSMAKKLKYNKIILTKANMDKARNPIKIKKYFKNPILTNNIKESINKAKQLAKKNDLILITGSIFLIGEAYPNLE
ncbi:bifunctional folylpolyglutamate synthase/dihydrofolate synthase [Candidatus Woesearchaeota archaeon]|nr:bifunctional folylpolyglutamate synthase/dihydrofolate synthase [Candidatus Woesearchaeota archaeon]